MQITPIGFKPRSVENVEIMNNEFQGRKCSNTKNPLLERVVKNWKRNGDPDWFRKVCANKWFPNECKTI